MSVQTFIIEWDMDNVHTLIVAENALRMKADLLKDRMLLIADEYVNCEEGEL